MAIATPPGTETKTGTRTIEEVGFDPEVIARVRQLRPHKVVVLDCQCHSFDDVERALCQVISGMTRAKAHEHAWEIHTTGASVVATAPKEKAEHYGERLKAKGLRVTVEEDS